MLDNTVTWVSGLFRNKDDTSTLAKSKSDGNSIKAHPSPKSTIPRTIKAGRSGSLRDDDWIVLDVMGRDVGPSPAEAGGELGKTYIATAVGCNDASNANSLVQNKMSRRERKQALRSKFAPVDTHDRGKELLAALKDREKKEVKCRKLAVR